MTWIDDLQQHLDRAGRNTWRHGEAVGVLFADGYDVWWIRPDHPEPWDAAEAAVTSRDLPAIVARLQDLDHRRARVLHVLRHWLTEQGWHYDLRGDGNAWLSNAGSSTNLMLGDGALTAAVIAEDHVATAVTAVLAQSWVEKPDATTVARLLALPAPTDPPKPSEDDVAAAHKTPLTTAIQCIGGCTRMKRGLDQVAAMIENGMSQADALAELKRREQAKPAARIRQTLDSLAAHLPGCTGALEFTDKSLHIDFHDGFGDFVIAPRGKDVQTLIRDVGPVAAGARLAARYRAEDRQRRIFFTALWHEAAARGWCKNRDWRVLHLGCNHREITLDPGVDLTRRLMAEGPGATFAGLFAENPDLVHALQARCAESLPGDGSPPHAPADADLMPAVAAPASACSASTDASADADLDAFAARIVQSAHDRQDFIHLSLDPAWWDPACDTWMDNAAWQDAARADIARYPWNITAQRILLDAGDPAALAWWTGILDGEFPHHDLDDAEIEVAWLRRHHHPDLASKLFHGAYAGEWRVARARAGDVEALRQLVAVWDDSDDMDWKSLARIPRPALAALAGPARLAAWRDRAVREVAQTWRWEMPNEHLVTAAGTHGWHAVAEALAANAHLPERIFLPMVPDNELYECGKFLAAWARLDPSAQVIDLVRRGHAHLPVMWAGARAMDEQTARTFRKMFPNHDHVHESNAPHWMRDNELGLAVAWLRCRNRAQATRMK